MSQIVLKNQLKKRKMLRPRRSFNLAPMSNKLTSITSQVIHSSLIRLKANLVSGKTLRLKSLSHSLKKQNQHLNLCQLSFLTKVVKTWRKTKIIEIKTLPVTRTKTKNPTKAVLRPSRPMRQSLLRRKNRRKSENKTLALSYARIMTKKDIMQIRIPIC